MSWILYAPAMVAVVVGLLTGPKGARIRDCVVLTLVSSICGVVLGLGTPLQAVLQEALFPGSLFGGLVYNIEFNTFAYFSGILRDTIVNCLKLGPVLAVVLLRTNGGRSTVNSIISAITVLIGYDLLGAFYYYANWYYLASSGPFSQLFSENVFNQIAIPRIAGNLFFPMFCDVLGGSIAGIVCGWAASEIVSGSTRQDRWRLLVCLGVRICVFIPVVGMIIAASYMIFVHPRSQNVVLTVAKQHGMHVTYGTIPTIPIPQTWAVPLDDASISGAFALHIATAASGPVVATMIALRDCDLPLASAQAVNISPQVTVATPLDLDGTAMGIVGGPQSLNIFPEHNGPAPKGLLSVKPGADVQVTPRSDQAGRTFRFFGDAELMLPASPGTVLVISATNLLGNFGLAATTRNRHVNYRFGPSGNGENGCRPVPLSGAEIPAGAKYEPPMSQDSIAIKIVEAQAGAMIIVRLNGATLELPPNVGFVARSASSTLVTVVSRFLVDVDEGTLVVGTDQYPLVDKI
jgi:hypothetical protein